MKPETFQCPHCHAQLTKSAAAWVLGEAGQGDIAEEVRPIVTCPGCGGPISTKAMVEGRYDYSNTMGAIWFLLWIPASIIISAIFNLGFWSSVGLGFLLAGAVVITIWLIVEGIKRLFRS